jgi:hypothetical protein
MKTAPCECCDHYCPAHEGRDCAADSTTTLDRVDWVAGSTLRVCDACADDMMDSGIFHPVTH